MLMKLSLIRNALHSIEDGIKHLNDATSNEALEQLARFDPADGSVSIENTDGSRSWYADGDLTKLPKAYGVKFAILHLIQGVELLIKAYLERVEPGSTSVKTKPGYSIGMTAAVRRLVHLRPSLLAPNHLELLLRAREIRNQVEHAELDMQWTAARRTALDFLSLANYLVFALHSVRLGEVFSFDPYREDGNRAGEMLKALLAETSQITIELVQAVATEWAASHPDERLFLCFQCGARGLSRSERVCVACGADEGLEIAILAEELEDLVDQMAKLKAEVELKRRSI